MLRNVRILLADDDRDDQFVFFKVVLENALACEVVSVYDGEELMRYLLNNVDDLPDIIFLDLNMPLKKGEAVIYNSATIHGATENLTKQIRLAATLLISSSQAQWLLYYKEKNSPNDKIEKYNLDLDTFTRLSKDGRPSKEVFAGYTSFKFPQINKNDFLKKVGNGKLSDNKYVQRIKNFISQVKNY